MSKRDPFELLDERVVQDAGERAASEDRTRRTLLLGAMRSQRIDRNLSQRQVAEAMGTTQSAISDIESGKTDAQLQTLQRYARGIGSRLDVALVSPNMPAYNEGTANGLWRLVERQSLGALFTGLATQSDEEHQSLARLSTLAKLPQAVVSPILDSLVRRGWIEERRGSLRGGEQIYSLSDGAGYMIGVSLHRSRVEGVLIDLDASIIESTRIPLEVTTTEAVLDAATQVVHRMYDARAGHTIVGVGVSVAGIVQTDGDHTQTGSVLFAPTLHDEASERSAWREFPLESDLQGRIQEELQNPSLLVAVENDANALAMHEYIKNGDDSLMVVLMTRTGIGSAFALRGEVSYGVSFCAGELGHLVVDPEGSRCTSGYEHFGCLETIASTKGILTRLGLPTGDAEEIDSGLASLAESDNPNLGEVLTDAGRAIGRTLSTVVAVHDPNRVIFYGPAELVGGTAAKHHQRAQGVRISPAAAFREGVSRGMKEASPMDKFLAHPELDWYELGDSTNAVAAGRAAMRHFLGDPTHWTPTVQETEGRTLEMSA